MSALHIGHIVSLETRAKISASRWRGGSKASSARVDAQRHLQGFNPLNSWSPGCDGHHINQNDVIYMPHKLHHSIYHNQRIGKGMARMNSLAGAFMCEDWT